MIFGISSQNNEYFQSPRKVSYKETYSGASHGTQKFTKVSRPKNPRLILFH